MTSLRGVALLRRRIEKTSLVLRECPACFLIFLSVVSSSHEKTDFRDVPDELWGRIEPLLAPFKRKRSGGSKPLSQRTILAGILYKCRSGCQWAMLPACYGSKSTVHEHFQRWSKAGVMTEIFRILLAEYGEKVGVDAQWQAMDGTLLQAPTRSQKNSG